jgi:hypothetical protein
LNCIFEIGQVTSAPTNREAELLQMGASQNVLDLVYVGTSLHGAE